ncbi:uncharacterized protein LOC143025197 [Oratosquilla oratoria]|uniref:uncharacterized protein LOC143025197 n=1 Tax=Oratosquilla oratoria TaxID=337810 RepID=UPI003F7642E7
MPALLLMGLVPGTSAWKQNLTSQSLSASFTLTLLTLVTGALLLQPADGLQMIKKQTSRPSTDRRTVAFLSNEVDEGDDHLIPEMLLTAKTKTTKTRKRRASFVWPSGSQFVAEFYVTIPIEAPSGVSIPFTIDVPYKFRLPNITKDILTRNIPDERLDVYGAIEGIFQNFGVDGRACVLRAVCERADSHLLNQGLLGEIVSLLLVASAAQSTENMYEYLTAEYHGQTNGDCWSLYPSCPLSFFNWMDG